MCIRDSSEGGAALFESALDALDGAFDGQYTPPAATGNVSVFVFDSGISGQLRVALPSFCELDRASCASAMVSPEIANTQSPAPTHSMAVSVGAALVAASSIGQDRMTSSAACMR